MKIAIDFESYYDSKEYTLRKQSMVEYVRDPRFKAWGLGFSMQQPDGKFAPPIWVTAKNIPAWLQHVEEAYGWKNVEVIGHNVKFDGLILRQVYGVQPGRWIDTKGMSRAVLGKRIKNHSLATIAEYFGYEPKGVMKTDGLKELTPDQERELADYCLHDVELGTAIFSKLAAKFPANQYEMLHWTVQMLVAPKILLDVELLKSTAESERARKKTIFAEVGIEKKIFSSNDKFAELLRKEGFEVPMKDSPKKKNPDGTPMQIPAFALGDPAFIDMMEGESERLQTLCEARVAAKSTLLETRSEKLARLGASGLWPFDVEFSGANQTHRFSGGSGAGGNPQNFNRCQDPEEHKKGHECKGRLRRAVKAPEGYKLVVGDFAAIEFRLVAYLSKDPGLIELIEKGIDPYCAFASLYYGRTITKKDDFERRFGKEAQLGLGYGMGWEKFKNRVKIKLGKNITEKEARDAVDLYRERYPRVPQLWYTLNSTIPFLTKNDRHIVHGLPVTFEKEAIILPSGLPMQYPNLRQELDDEGRPQWIYDIWEKNKLQKRKLYGGKVLENISQGLAGELCKEAAQQFGDKVTGLVHDEIHLLVRAMFARMAKQRLERVMTMTPAWLPRIKLKAEVGIGPNWLEAK